MFSAQFVLILRSRRARPCEALLGGSPNCSAEASREHEIWLDVKLVLSLSRVRLFWLRRPHVSRSLLCLQIVYQRWSFPDIWSHPSECAIVIAAEIVPDDCAFCGRRNMKFQCNYSLLPFVSCFWMSKNAKNMKIVSRTLAWNFLFSKTVEK